MCGSDGLSSSSSLLICGKSCRCQAENPLNDLSSFTRPALRSQRHREPLAFGDARRCLRGPWGCRFRCSFRRTQNCDCLEKALPMSEGHAEFSEVAFRQFAQDLGVDVILAK